MRIKFSSGLVASFYIFTVYAAQPTASRTVDLGYAKYEGSLNNQTGNVEFLGLRFAATPTGSLRWREPRPPRTTPGIQKADALPNRCWEAGQGNQPVAPFPLDSHNRGGSRSRKRALAIPDFSEDSEAKKDLPVIVWIHGGGYMAGSASGFSGTDVFDGDDLVREAGGGVIAVIIQYRLGVFGFLAGKKVHDGGVLNAGLLDQQFAFQWVQTHISKFGGDPRRVTIWGESAGAGSVLQHVIANNGNTRPPLFRAAITSSTFLPSQYAFDDRIPEQLYAEIVNGTGCSSTVDTLECLRQVDVNLLQESNTNVGDSGFFGTFIFVPVVDGHLITKRPTQLMREGRVNGVALLSVTNTFEGALFVNMNTSSTVQTPSYLANLFPEFRDTEVAEGTAQYAKQGAPIDQAVAIMGESIFICPTYFLLRAFKNKSYTRNRYLRVCDQGEFAIPPGGHGNDVIYYFPNQTAGVLPSFDNAEFLNNFSQSFLNFAMSLDPNVKWDPSNTVPHWPRWSEQTRNEMLFNKTDADVPVFHSITTSNELLERCDFWERVSAFSVQ
ncbi:Lipase 3 [Leucoagaricus sp. SymC.cos]|nr:Lipase 3 [Leucoagaricus sp. SymC.cos]